MTERPLTPKGQRPYPTGEPHVERVLSIAMAVATDVAALHERVDTIARLAGAANLFTAADLDAYDPPPEVAAEREAWRKAYLSRILRIMHEATPRDNDPVKYQEFVSEISEPVDPR